MFSVTLACASALWACGAPAPSGPTPTSTAPPASALITVNGALHGDSLPGNRIGPFNVPLAGGEITVMAGAATGTVVTSDATGAFELQLPPGPLRLKFSKTGFKTQTNVYGDVGSAPIALGKVVLGLAPWTITGVVTDSHQQAFVGATVTIDRGGAFPEHHIVTTDASGRYRFTSEQAHGTTVQLSVDGTGIEPIFLRNTPCCNTAGDTVADLATLRVLRVIGVSPDTLRVGDAIELPASRVFFDDGSQRQLFLMPVSSVPDVLTVSRGEQGWIVRANRAGEATLTMEYRGLTDWVRVVIQ